MGRNPFARARHALSKVSETLPRRAHIGANSRVQATGRLETGGVLARHWPRFITWNPDARAVHALSKVRCRPPRRAHTGANSRVQATGRPAIGGMTTLHWPRCTTWNPDVRAIHALSKVRCWLPRLAHTGANSRVQACGRTGT